jgi:hypothetical protein
MMVPESSAATRGIPEVWGNVPQRNRNFTGRAAILDRLRKRHLAEIGSDGPDDRVAAVVQQESMTTGLQGLGGVGKTAVAIEYAWKFRDQYDLVWWIPADQLPLVRSSLARLAERLGLPGATATGIETAAAATLDALRRGEPYRRWLLIFDNADQPEELNDLIPRGTGDVLVTSRNPQWDAFIASEPLDVFSREESVDFLTKRVRTGLTEADADRLAEELGDLPLALEQAGAYMAETGMPLDEYLELFAQQVTEVLNLGKAHDYPLSMSAAWRMSVNRLQEDTPQAQELLRCCAYFGPESIPRDVFRRGTRASTTRVSELVTNPIRLSAAVRDLSRFALVKLDGRTLTVHRLIQALIRDQIDPAEQDGYRHEVHLILAAAAPRDPRDRDQWRRYAELLAHVTSSATELPRCQDEGVRAFALDALRYLNASGDFSTCRSLADRFNAQWSQDSGADSPDVLVARRLRGDALRGMGQYREAYLTIEETLHSAQEGQGETSHLTLALRNSRGADLRARGEFEAACRLDEETRALHDTVFGSTDPQTLRVMNNLGVDYSLTSRNPEARDLMNEVLNLWSDSERGSASDVLLAWNNLARAIRLCGDFADARDVGEDAYEYGQEFLGHDHYLTLRAANDLSIAERRVANDYDRSLELANLAYEQFLRQFGESNPDTMAAAIALTNIQRTMSQIDRASELAERTVARYPEIYGPDHPYNFGCLGNLALLRRVAGAVTEARKLNEDALSRLDEALGRDHLYSITVAINLASDLARLGDTVLARALSEDTLARSRRVLGDDHPVTLGCAANLVQDLEAENAADEAAALRSSTMDRYARTRRPDHPDVLAALAGRRLDFDFDPPPI